MYVGGLKTVPLLTSLSTLAVDGESTNGLFRTGLGVDFGVLPAQKVNKMYDHLGIQVV